jgi:hypothetical protein
LKKKGSVLSTLFLLFVRVAQQSNGQRVRRGVYFQFSVLRNSQKMRKIEKRGTTEAVDLIFWSSSIYLPPAGYYFEDIITIN